MTLHAANDARKLCHVRAYGNRVRSAPILFDIKLNKADTRVKMPIIINMATHIIIVHCLLQSNPISPLCDSEPNGPRQLKEASKNMGSKISK